MYENERKNDEEEEENYDSISKPRSVIGRIVKPIHIKLCISL